MILDWNRFRQILETTENKRLISIIDHVDFLNDFLIQLSQELKQIPTATECAKRYPAIGPLLTLASTHPYLGYSPNLAHNLITCLMDYSKLDSSLIENTNSLSLPTLERSALWCIIRLRRFLVVNQDDTTTDRLISQILETIKSKQNHLCTETIAPLVDKCIALVHQKSLSPVIELLVKCALSEDDEVDPIHFDLKKPLFSDRFIYHLSQSDSIHHRSTLRDHYQCWSKDIQIKILNQIDDFLEMEVLCLIETFTQSYRYMNPDEISNQLKKENLVKLAQSSTRLSEKLIQKVSSYVDLFQDWRIVRLVQCLHPCLSIKLYKQCDSEKYTIKNSAKIAQRVYNLLSDHIYCGPVQDIPQRRTMAWCISMSLPRLLWYCVNGIINWCKNNELWTEEMNKTLEYINWVLYPSIDHRQQASFLNLKNWIYSCKGIENLRENFKKIPIVLLDSNGMVIACFLTAYLMSERVQKDQLESLLNKVFALPFQQNSTKMLDQKDNMDRGSVYLFLDCLYDIQLHQEYYCPSSLIPLSIVELITFVKHQFLVN